MAKEAMKVGGHGYVTKIDAASELLKAIHAVAAFAVGRTLSSVVGRRAKCSWKLAFVLNRLSQILPFQPRSYIHSQNSKTAHGIDESCPSLIGTTVVLRKHQPPLVYFRLGCLNALPHLRPIGFEQGGLI
jgi:hypothetical protein